MSVLLALVAAVVSILRMPTASFSQSSNAEATIVEIRNGTASVEESHNSRTRRATPGTALRWGDLIIPNRGVVVAVQCTGGLRVRYVRRISGVGEVCPDNVSPRFTTRGSR